MSALLLAVVGCAAEEPGAKKSDGSVTVALASFSKEKLYPPAFDPGGLVYFGPMFDFVIGAAPDGSLSNETGALEAWEPNDDASEWTFTLRSGMKWHDGEDVTADDLVFTINEFASPDATCGGVCGALAANLASVEAVDEHTVKMTLKAPDVNIPAQFGPIEGSIMLLPQHHVEKVGWDGFESDPLGSGPWKFVSRELGQSISYEANDDYWNEGHQPKFKKLDVVLAPDQNTRVAMLKSGEADLIAISPDQVPVSQSDGFDILTVENTVFSEILFFKSSDPEELTHKLEFRKALALAIDMDEVIEAFYPEEAGKRTSGDAVPFSETTLGHDPDLEPYPYDPEEAKALLKEAGYDGSTIKIWTVTFPDGPEQKDVNEAIAGFWSKVGLKVEIVQSEFATLKEQIDKDGFDPAPGVAVTGFPTSNRPSVLTNMQSLMMSPDAGGSYRTYWDPKTADTLHAELAKIVDDATRDERLREINRELYEQYWSIPIAMKNTLYAAGDRIDGWEPISGISKVLSYETLRPTE
ncbi:ABC transporter substrate-binding protein [Nocardioides humi]|uniref:ABC transporter substrate-binding protein n=1 Tax=Nocardioides humi TaxID=449461 RepID=UPI0015E864EE|nr:ABC transporter substrate-binding protein [Nocardioides humi]